MTEIGNRELKEIDLMIFKIMGVVLGIDIKQISQIREPDYVEAKDINVFAFHQKIPFRGNKVLYKSPKILFIKDKGPASGIIIDQPEEIISIKTGSIQPLPPLIKRFNRSTPIWGVVPRGEKIILLIDLCRLLKSKTCKYNQDYFERIDKITGEEAACTRDEWISARKSAGKPLELEW